MKHACRAWMMVLVQHPHALHGSEQAGTVHYLQGFINTRRKLGYGETRKQHYLIDLLLELT
jgi:hypothetical protein